ncbi:MAG: MarR family winged helix-turn-helix transcriptional regulator [Dehalococcoidales bacterium]
MSKKDRSQVPTNEASFNLWRLFNHTVFIIIRTREQELAKFGLTMEQAYVLDMLNTSHGIVTIQAIVNTTLLRHHYVSTLLSRMALQGLIKKVRSTTDARQFDIMMLPKGQSLFNKITRNSITEILSELSVREQNSISIKLRKLMLKAYKLIGRKLQPNIFVD